MSGWTVVTVRGRKAENYDLVDHDSTDPVRVVEDIIATAEEDKRVRNWTLDSPEVYLYLNCERYGFEFAEEWLEDYSEMVRDAVVLGANDTTDTGTARYYDVSDEWSGSGHKDEYKETQSEDGTRVGKMALAVMNARHGIIAQDPFHDWTGRLDGMYEDEGTNRL